MALNQYKYEGILSPGFCPYSNKLSQKNYFEIQQFLKKNLITNNVDLAATNLIITEENKNKFSEINYSYSSGVSILEGQTDELWIEIIQQSFGKFDYNIFKLESETRLIIVLAVTVIVGVLFGYFSL